MKSDKHRFKTMIGKRDYVIVSTKSLEHLRTVADDVNRQLDSIKEQTPTLDAEERAVLVAVNAVSKQLDLSKQLRDVQSDMTSMHQQLDDLAKNARDDGSTLATDQVAQRTQQTPAETISTPDHAELEESSQQMHDDRQQPETMLREDSLHQDRPKQVEHKHIPIKTNKLYRK